MKRRVLVLEGGRASAAEVAAGGKGQLVALEGSRAPIPCPDVPALKNVLSELTLAPDDVLIVVADEKGRAQWCALLAEARPALPAAWELRCLEPLLPHEAQGKNTAVSLARHLASQLAVEAPLAPSQKEREELQKAIAQEETEWQQERQRLREEIETLKRQRDALRGNLDGKRLKRELASALRREGEDTRSERQRLEALIQHLFADTVAAMTRWGEELQKMLEDNAPSGASWSARLTHAAHGQEHDYWFRRQIFEAVNALPRSHFVNFAVHRAWVRLALRAEEEFNWLVSFHGYGNTGLRAICSLIFERVSGAAQTDNAEPGEREAGELATARPAMIEPFLFGYHEDEVALAARYAVWLEEAKELALAEWLTLLRSV